ncbi:MAG: DUF481 domain-containing protein [Pseudomonadales bacterium]|nr:DUF481 domain-containing protein [Pseudomonadales bacterium]
MRFGFARIITTSLLLACSLGSSTALAIVDVQDSYSSVLEDGVTNTLGFSFSGASGNDDSSKAEISEHFHWRANATTLMFLASWERGDSNGNDTADNSFAHLRYVRRLTDTFAIESYLQFQQDQFVELQRRRLLGAGVRFELWEQQNDRRLAVGAGLMQEYERYTGATDETRELRANLYASVSLPLSDGGPVFTLSSYLQPALDDWGNLRTVNNMSLKADIAQAFAVKFSLGYHYNGEPVRGVDKGDFKYATSLEYTF